MPRKKGQKVEVDPGGRPQRDFNKKLFENLCHVHCTQAELECILSTDIAVLDKWCHRTYGVGFTVAYSRFASGGKASLRRTQFRLAENSAPMAIWMGKIHLGQRDMAEVDDKINKALGLLETAKTLRVVDDRADTVVKTDIKHSGSNSKV